MVVMVFGTTEIGRAIYTYNTLDKAIRDGVRHLSQHGPGDTVIQGEARCLAVHGNTGCTGAVLAPGLTTGHVQICDSVGCPGTHAAVPTTQGVINLVTMSVTNYRYNSMVTLVMPSLDFNAIQATMRAQL